MIKVFIPLSDLAMTLADVDERGSSQNIHTLIFSYLRAKVNISIRQSVEVSWKSIKSVLIRIMEKTSEMTLSRVKRTQKHWPKFSFTSVYKDLQPWFKDTMKKKIESKPEHTDSKKDLNLEKTGQPVVYSSTDHTEPFFSIVGQSDQVKRPGGQQRNNKLRFHTGDYLVERIDPTSGRQS